MIIIKKFINLDKEKKKIKHSKQSSEPKNISYLEISHDLQFTPPFAQF